MSDNKRIAKNAAFLYGRLIINLFISFYTTRIILNALGVVDYGIYNVIFGMVTFCAFFSFSVTTGIQRFFSIEIGRKNQQNLNRYYNASVRMITLLSLAFLILGFALSFVFFDGVLNIPPQRMEASRITYYIVIVVFFFNLLRIPFTALINAHEDIQYIAVLSIYESVGKLGIAWLLTWVSIDRLLAYSWLTLLLSAIVSLAFVVYCNKKYKHCRLSKDNINKEIYKKLAGFSGWHTALSTGVIIKEQGEVMLLNIFFGAVTNAAFGIAGLVLGQIRNLGFMMFNAVSPRITSDFGSGQIEKSNLLMINSSRYVLLLMGIALTPVFFDLPLILKLWLKSYPAYTIEFCRIFIVYLFIDLTTYPLTYSISASGRIATYSMVIVAVNITSLITLYFAFSGGMGPLTLLYISTTNIFISGIIRLYFAQKLSQLNIKQWSKNVAAKSYTTLGAIIVLYVVSCLIWQPSVWRFILHISFALVISGIFAFFIGLYHSERLLLTSYISTKFKRIKI